MSEEMSRHMREMSSSAASRVEDAAANYIVGDDAGEASVGEFIRLGECAAIAKGRPPLRIPYDGADAAVYLSPEYLRGRAVGVFAQPSADAVRVADGDAVLLWDGSNAGEFFHGRQGVAASTMARITALGEMERAYFVHALKQFEARLKSKTNGTGIPHVDREVLEGLQLYKPGLAHQRVIARVLDTLDTALRQTEAIITKLKQVKQGLLHDLLTRGIDANGELRPPQPQAPHLYKQSPLGWIPKEWEVRCLGEIADVNRGKFTHRPRNDPAYLGGAHPFIQTGDVAASAGGYVHAYSQTLSDRGARVSQEFPAGTIAITIAANIADTAILGRPMFFPDSVVGAVVKEDANVRFVELSVRRAKATLDARAPQSAQKNINLQDLRPLPIAFPSCDEQDAIAERYEAADTRLSAEVNTASNLRQLKSGLMDDLLTGRVRVTPLLEAAATP